jgi:hypothetical protein
MSHYLRAMPFRPALPMNRARILGLGLTVGITIALAGCSPSFGGPRCEDHRARWVVDDEACQAKLSLSVRNPGGTWNDDARRACAEAAFFTSYAVCEGKNDAPRIEAR